MARRNRALTRAKLRRDPASVLTFAGMTPDPWQADLLRDPAQRTLLLCSRQAGKSETAAALGLVTALLHPNSLVLLLSPSERQSAELAAKVLHFYDAAGQPILPRKRTELQLHLTNGSRVIALPSSEATIRGYSGAALLVVDEASRVPDELYRAVRPMLAVSGGRLICLSTPFGQQGFFFEEWTDSAREWKRVKVTASECPRISAAFLEEEKVSLGQAWYRQEYECSFESMQGAEWPAEYFERIHFHDWPEGIPWVATAMALDPSKGKDLAKPKADRLPDYSAFCWGAVMKDGTVWLDADLNRDRDVARIVADGIGLYRTCPFGPPSAFVVEVNAFQSLLAADFQRETKALSMPPMPLYGINNFEPKDVRIRQIGPFLARRELRIRDSTGGKLLVSQLRDFPMGEYRDGPDSLQMLLVMLLYLIRGNGSGAQPRLLRA